MLTGTVRLVSFKDPQKWFCSNYEAQRTNELSGGSIQSPQGPLKRAKAMEPITGLFILSFLFKIFPPWANNSLALLGSDMWHCKSQSPALYAMGQRQMARGSQGRSRSRLPGQLSSCRNLLCCVCRSACLLSPSMLQLSVLQNCRMSVECKE